VRLASLALVVLCACKTEGTRDANDAGLQTSPQASAVPAPIATPIAFASSDRDSGPPPTPFRGDVGLEAESAGKDVAGYTIAMVLRLPDAPAVAAGPTVNVGAIDALRKENEPRFTIDLTPMRMRMQLTSLGFILPRDSEIRARVDHYGHVFVTPDLATYRVLAPGSLRALFGERRVDVAPLSPAEVTMKGDGTRRLGQSTRKAEVVTRAGRGVFEIVKLAELGDGGALLVRALLDLMNAQPQTSVVGPDELPVHAELHWASRGALLFDVTQITKRNDLGAQSMAVPPSGATFTQGALQASGGELRVEPKELAAIHSGPIDLGPQAAGTTTGSLGLINVHDTPRFAWIDGAPVAWVAADARIDLSPLPRGRYQIEWRPFFDDAIEPAKTETVPLLPETIKPDAGH
jgi:hypothetical protein